jgi:hypothetical protein
VIDPPSPHALVASMSPEEYYVDADAARGRREEVDP